jgi:hypothetical protein
MVTNLRKVRKKEKRETSCRHLCMIIIVENWVGKNFPPPSLEILICSFVIIRNTSLNKFTVVKLYEPESREEDLHILRVTFFNPDPQSNI